MRNVLALIAAGAATAQPQVRQWVTESDTNGHAVKLLQEEGVTAQTGGDAFAGVTLTPNF